MSIGKTLKSYFKSVPDVVWGLEYIYGGYTEMLCAKNCAKYMK